MYSIVVDEGLVGGHSDRRETRQSYTVHFVVGNADTGPVHDPDLQTHFVSFNVVGVWGTPYSVTVTNIANGAVYTSNSGFFDLPDGDYHFAVSASGYTTDQGFFTVEGTDLTNITVFMSDRVTVTFITIPADATMELKIGQNDFIAPTGNKVYQVQPGLEYTYVVMRDGFIVGSSRFTPIANMTLTISLEPGQDGQGNGGNTLTLLSPSDFTLGELSDHYSNVIHTPFELTQNIVFEFTMGAGVNNLNEDSFINERLPLIQIVDRYPGGRVVSTMEYLGFDWANQIIKIGATTGRLPEGTYYIVFGRDVCGNNVNKTLGKDVVFQFTVGDGEDKEDGKEYHDVWFDTRGGTPVGRQRVEHGEKADRPENPTWGNNVFDGWYLDDTLYDFNAPVTGNLLLVAHWRNPDGAIIVTTPDVFDVIFDSRGGSHVDPQTVPFGETAVRPEDPVWDDNVFDGWYLGGRLYDFDALVTRDILLVAQWLDPEGTIIETAPTPLGVLMMASFRDIPEDAWYTEAVAFVLERGLFVGTSNTEFSPDVAMDRGMFISVLGRLAGINADTEVSADLPFHDVNGDEYFAFSLAWAVKNGLIGGYEDESFGAERTITRQEVVALLYRFGVFMELDMRYTVSGMLSTYTDVSELWAGEQVSWAFNTGLMVGKTADTLNPDDTATRAEMAALIQRFVVQCMEVEVTPDTN